MPIRTCSGRWSRSPPMTGQGSGLRARHRLGVQQPRAATVPMKFDGSWQLAQALRSRRCSTTSAGRLGLRPGRRNPRPPDVWVHSSIRSEPTRRAFRWSASRLAALTAAPAPAPKMGDFSSGNVAWRSAERVAAGARPLSGPGSCAVNIWSAPTRYSPHRTFRPSSQANLHRLADSLGPSTKSDVAAAIHPRQRLMAAARRRQ